ncbi:hypothetical protein [Tahibacter sp.]|uniref:hypothetical protein n=1 Tax=Tahibacter sp. TaxID=2056211 RepID=UPI0028C3B48D|nr:hypothetical protein [Tahibacter sp.]
MNRSRWSRTLVGIIAAIAPVAAWRYTAEEVRIAGGCDQVVEALEQSLRPDPFLSANESVEKGDLRYLGVHGYTIFYPGIQHQYCLRKADEGKVIEGTGDLQCSAEHMKLQRQAVEFAEAYNAEITRSRVSLKFATCTK